MNIPVKSILPRISNIISIALLSSALFTIIIDFSKYGIVEGFFYENTFIYAAFTYNLIFFGAYFCFLLFKYNYLALPIFLITYSVWDGIGIAEHIYTPSGIYWPYIQWWVILTISLVIAIALRNKQILEFKTNSRLLIILFISWIPSVQYILSGITPFYDHLLYTSVTFLLCYYSIKPTIKPTEYLSEKK